MKRISLILQMIAIFVISVIVSTAQNQVKPLSDCSIVKTDINSFSTVGTKIGLVDTIKTLDLTDKTVATKYSSSQVENFKFAGFFTSSDSSLIIGIFSDDGVKVKIDNQDVNINNFGKGQALPDFENFTSLKTLNGPWTTNVPHYMEIEYSNICHPDSSDIDGLTVYFCGNATIDPGTPAIEPVPVSVSLAFNNTINNFPYTGNTQTVKSTVGLVVNGSGINTAWGNKEWTIQIINPANPNSILGSTMFTYIKDKLTYEDQDVDINLPSGVGDFTLLAKCSNISSSLLTYKISDVTPPEFVSIPDIVTEQITKASTPVNNITWPTVKDNYSPNTNVYLWPVDKKDSYQYGVSYIQWGVKDKAENIAYANQKVNIVDTTGPQMTIPPDITIIKGETDIGWPSYNDICCDNEEITISNNAPILSQLIANKITNVIWSAVDASNNTTTGTQHVTVLSYTAKATALSIEFLTNPANYPYTNIKQTIHLKVTVNAALIGIFDANMTIAPKPSWNVIIKRDGVDYKTVNVVYNSSGICTATTEVELLEAPQGYKFEAVIRDNPRGDKVISNSIVAYVLKNSVYDSENSGSVLRYANDGWLQVVAGSTSVGSKDIIYCEFKPNPTDKNGISWRISGSPDTEFDTMTGFNVYANIISTNDPEQLENLSPRIYHIYNNLSGGNTGYSEVARIGVFPSVEVSKTLTIPNSQASTVMMQNFSYVMTKCKEINYDGPFTFNTSETSFSIDHSAQWKEVPNNNSCIPVWDRNIGFKAGCDARLDFPSILPPTVPPFVANANFFLSLAFEVSINGGARINDNFQLASYGSSKGDIKFSGGCTADLFKGIVSAEGSIATSISCEGTIEATGSIKNPIISSNNVIKWDGIYVEFTSTCLWGTMTLASKTWEVCGEKEFYNKTLQLYP
jgi:hypothetical protein